MKNLKIFLIGCCSIFIAQTSNAQWVELGSGIEQTPRAIWTLSVPDENTVWAFTWDDENIEATFEFTRTFDGGQTWEPGLISIDSDLYVQFAFALNDTVAWLATTDLQAPASGKIYKTVDGGQSWNHQNTAFTGLGETPSAIHFFDEQNGVAFGAGAYELSTNQISIYTTEDGGELWTKVPPANMSDQLFGEGMTIHISSGLFSAIGDTILFPTTKGRVFKSTDQGQNWEVFETNLSNPPYYFISMTMKDESNGILITAEPDVALRTTDGGITWEELSFDLPGVKPRQIRYIPGTDGAYIIHDGWNDFSSLALLTLDGGDTWELIDAEASVAASYFLSSSVGYGGGTLNGADSGGLYKWENGDLISDLTSLSQGDQLKLFPNPVTDQLHLRFSKGIKAQRIDISTVSGQTLYEAQILEEQNSHFIHAEHFPTGVYILRLFIEDRIVSKKFTRL